MRKVIRTAILLMATIIIPNFASANLIFESGSGNVLSSGTIIADSNWVYHRFELSNKTTISAIGGLFDGFGQTNVTLFGGVIALKDRFDLPNSFDLDTDDLLGTSTLNISGGPTEYFTDLSLNLDAGWYSLVFGTGAFGADNVPFANFVGTNHVEDDLDSQLTYVGIRPGNPVIDPYQFRFQAPTSRFLISAEVPEPSTLMIFSPLLFLLARKRSKT
jgi:hypothetical protein